MYVASAGICETSELVSVPAYIIIIIIERARARRSHRPARIGERYAAIVRGLAARPTRAAADRPPLSSTSISIEHLHRGSPRDQIEQKSKSRTRAKLKPTVGRILFSPRAKQKSMACERERERESWRETALLMTIRLSLGWISLNVGRMLRVRTELWNEVTRGPVVQRAYLSEEKPAGLG